MNNLAFTEKDEKIIAEKGISLASISQSLERFKKGFKPISLIRPAAIDDGIKRLTIEEQNDLESLFDSYQGTIMKFVPASGAASRMFKALQAFRNSYSGSIDDYNEFISNQEDPVFIFFKNLDSFAFYPELKKVFDEKNAISLEEAHLSRDYVKILDFFLGPDGLNYAQLPKGLLKFHSYSDLMRTPAEEQILEGWSHCSGNELEVHFTVSPDHLMDFKKNVKEVVSSLEFGDSVKVSYSTQKKSTDIIAVDPSDEPFRDESGALLFRPAGHGALLENLSELDADLIFIKNIDNILPDHKKSPSIKWKKLLAGLLIEYQNKVFNLLEQAENGTDITDEANELLPQLGVLGRMSEDEIFDFLNRPIRICGMVKNEGEPGGGPFWTDSDGSQTLQIVESAQIDQSNPSQLEILNSSTHFNPVDLVCSIKSFKGETFDLEKYRDSEQGFISTKSYQGKELKAMELPGLWNGSMANWNTVFVEVPIETFSPVKTINDLLKKEHQPSEAHE